MDKIKTKKEYQNTLQAIEGLMKAEAKTLDGERLDLLVSLVEEYEKEVILPNC